MLNSPFTHCHIFDLRLAHPLKKLAAVPGAIADRMNRHEKKPKAINHMVSSLEMCKNY